MPERDVPGTEALDARLAFAARIATRAGERLLALRKSGRWKEERVLGDVADQAADGYIQGAIAGAWPDDGVLSEETADSRERLTKRLVWIVDPLDGTKEYRSGRHDWAVHVALAIDGAPALAAVALPAIGRTLVACSIPGRERAWIEGTSGDSPRVFAEDPRGAVRGRPLRLLVSRSHTPDWIGDFGRALGDTTLVPCGSVGFKVAMLVLGDADVYVHKQGLKEWDTCAPEVIARATGWAVSRADGTPHRYNEPNPRHDQFVACRPWLHARVVEALAAATA